MKLDIIRAWKDEGYRSSLSEEERHILPESPVGELELTDAELEAVFGGGDSNSDNSDENSDNSDNSDDENSNSDD